MAEDINNSLFSQDVLDSMESENLFNQVKIGPVTVLGLTFENDAERRAYFREELRKKLPELKKIEGFPVGEDEDIIALSDPPYYTACPNPWLNDFIAYWEEEKKQLVAEKKRVEQKIVTEPYAADVSEGKNNAIYMAHAYHTKCPHPAIMRYILHYTEPGDIVFDGFCGTGMTSVAANLCGNKNEVLKLNQKKAKLGARHSICSDLSPIASLISASYTLPFNPKSFEKKANAILDEVEKEYGWMYETVIGGHKAKINYTIWSDVLVCPSCGHEVVLWDGAVDLDAEMMNDSFPCPHCGTECSKKNAKKAWATYYDDILNDTAKENKKQLVRVNYTLGTKRGEKDVDASDLALLERISSIRPSHAHTWKLKDGFNTRQPIESNGIEYTHQFFTRRNFIVLLEVYDRIKDDSVLRAWFTSVLQNTSKMYKFRLDRKGGIVNGTLFVPSLNIEQNALKVLRAKIRDFTQIYYPERGNNAVSILSATNLDTIADNGIDYIFIDPPFGANIMYSEVSSIWESWLRVMTEDTDEAIVNDVQNKTLFDYQDLMNRSLREFYRVLKPGKWLTMEFSNTSASVWNSIQNALQGVGFIVANVAALDKKQGSFKAVTTPTAVKQDLIITCFKPSEAFTMKFDSQDGAQNIWDFVEEYLEHLPVHLLKDNATTAVVERSPKILYDRLITYYVQKGLPVPIDAADFQAGLRERYAEEDGMFFMPSQLVEYREKKKLAPEFVSMGLIVSNEADGIEWLRNQLRDRPQTYQDIQPGWMQAINGIRKGDILPELSDLLEENFIQETDGKWRLPNIQDDVDKDKLREKALLKEFKIYVEAASKPHARIKEVRVEAIRAGFKKCYMDKDFSTIVMVGDKIPQNLLTEDDILLQFYDIARTRI